jgi:hypothetical protein
VHVIAVDWSGAKVGERRKIWRADVVGGRLVGLANGRSRDELAQDLIQTARSEPRLVVGFDFAFSMPAWFAKELRVTSAPALWKVVSHRAESWLEVCEPPFWGRPGRGRCDQREPFRRAEAEVARVGGIGPKSIFQVGGAGAVGTGSLRGMAVLTRLRAAGFSIWPFDQPRLPMVVEIYPRLFTGPVVKSSLEPRLALLKDRYRGGCGDLLEKAAASEDAFDAAVSALAMSAQLPRLLTLEPASDPVTRLEGAIWIP